MATLAVRNNNPGNLKDPATGSFRTFPDQAQGEAALERDLTGKVTGNTSTGLKPTSSIYDFASTYAPKSDNNDPVRYAQNLASQLGVAPETPLSSLQGRIHDFAAAVAHNEDFSAPGLQKATDQPLASKQIDGRLTHAQMIANINAMEQQGAQPQEIQGYLDSLKGGDTQSGYSPKPFSNASPGQFNFSGSEVASPTDSGDKGVIGEAADNLSDVGTGVSKAISDTATGKINPLSGLLQGAGAIGKGVGDLTNTALKHTPIVGGLLKAGENIVGDIAQKAAGTDIGKQAISGYQGFAQDHPELAGDIGAGVNIATAIPVFKGLGLAKGALTGVAERALGKAAADPLAEALTPRVTGKAYEKAALKGQVRGPGLLQGAGISPEAIPSVQTAKSAVQSAAEALGKKPEAIVKPGVGEATNNLNRVIQTTKDYAQNIVSPFVQESGVNYNFSDLQKALSQVQPPKGLTGSGLAAWNRMKDNTIEAVANKIGPDVKGIRSLSEMRAKAVEGKIPEKVSKGDEDFWDARKMIDDIYEKETNGKVFGDAELNGAKAGYKDLRGAFKDYLSEGYRYPDQIDKVNKVNDFLRSPQGAAMNKAGWSVEDMEKQFGLQRNPLSDAKATEWEHHMDTLSGLYDAQKNLVTNVGQERGLTGMGVFAKKHPVFTGLLKKGTKLVGEGAGIGAGINLFD